MGRQTLLTIRDQTVAVSDHSRSIPALFKTIVASRQVSTYHTERHQTIALQHLAGADARAGDMQDVDAVQAASQRGFRLRLVDDAAPVVVLLGWFGAKDKTVAKYGSLVNSLGYSHMRALLPSEHVIWPWDGGRARFARLVLDFLLESGLAADRQLIFYCFSNGGVYAYEEVCKLFAQEEQYQKVQQAISGLVLDSAPSYMRLSSLHRATTLVLQPRFPAWAGLLVTLMVWLLCVGVATVSLVRDGAFPPRAVQYWSWLEGMKPGVPELYLYSSADELTDWSQLQHLIATRRDRGNDITAEEFEGSPHCGHLRAHPAQYSTCVSSFLQRALAANSKHKPSLKA